MPVELYAFLTAYRPKAICLSCLCTVTERAEDDVWQTITTLLTEGRVEAEIAECLNCSATTFVVRRR
jgi:hypothetical protein